MWVVQEVVVANNPPLIRCGSRLITLKRVLLPIEFLNSSGYAPQDMFQDTRAILELKQMMSINEIPRRFGLDSFKLSSPKDFGDLLLATRDRQANLPVDKIFALLGLTMYNPPKDLVPDYSQHYSTIYQKAMFHVLKSQSDLNFLFYAMSKRSLDVPSWCVDFSQTDWDSYVNQPELLFLQQSAAQLLDASLDPKITEIARKRLRMLSYRQSDRATETQETGVASAPQFGSSINMAKSIITHDPSSGILKVSGSIIGCLEYVSIMAHCKAVQRACRETEEIQRLASSTEDQNFLGLVAAVSFFFLEDIASLCHHMSLALKLRFGVTEALRMLSSGTIWRVCMLPTLRYYGEPDEHAQLQRTCGDIERCAQNLSRAYRAKSQAWSRLESSSPGSKEPVEEECNITAFFKWGTELVDQTFLTTDTGYVGWVPSALNTIQEGDMLCILHGCGAPVVLRQKDGVAFKVVSFACIDGVMNGEYFKDVERNTVLFPLC